MIEYRRMEQTQEPLHSDGPKTKLNLTILFSLVVIVIGLLQANTIVFLMGVGVAIYSWLTNAKKYDIYRDALVITYGLPRVKAFPFQQIANSELLSLPIGDRLRVRMVNGSRIMLMTKDPETFRNKLDEALKTFHGEQRGTDYATENELDTGIDTPTEKPLDGVPTEENLGESSSENDNVPY